MIVMAGALGQCRHSVGMTGYLRSTTAHQEIEIAALVSLHDMVDVELAIAANQQVFWRLDIGQASGQFGLGDIQVQASSGAVQFNPVTFLHSRQWPAGCRRFGPGPGTRQRRLAAPQRRTAPSRSPRR